MVVFLSKKRRRKYFLRFLDEKPTVDSDRHHDVNWVVIHDRIKSFGLNDFTGTTKRTVVRKGKMRVVW